MPSTWPAEALGEAIESARTRARLARSGAARRQRRVLLRPRSESTAGASRWRERLRGALGSRAWRPDARPQGVDRRARTSRGERRRRAGAGRRPAGLRGAGVPADRGGAHRHECATQYRLAGPAGTARPWRRGCACWARRVPASELLRLGTATEVIADADVVARAQALAATIAGFPADAVATIKGSLRAASTRPAAGRLVRCLRRQGDPSWLSSKHCVARSAPSWRRPCPQPCARKCASGSKSARTK